MVPLDNLYGMVTASFDALGKFYSRQNIKLDA
jgi:hypothetical protein